MIEPVFCRGGTTMYQYKVNADKGLGNIIF